MQISAAEQAVADIAVALSAQYQNAFVLLNLGNIPPTSTASVEENFLYLQILGLFHF